MYIPSKWNETKLLFTPSPGPLRCYPLPPLHRPVGTQLRQWLVSAGAWTQTFASYHRPRAVAKCTTGPLPLYIHARPTRTHSYFYFICWCDTYIGRDVHERIHSNNYGRSHSHCAKVYADSYNALYSAQAQLAQSTTGTACMHCPPPPGPLSSSQSVYHLTDSLTDWLCMCFWRR